MNSFKNYIFILLSIVLGTQLSAQVDFQTKLSYSKVGVEDVFNVTYSTNKEGTFIPPSFTDFNLVGGPFQSTSSSINIVNGKMTQTMEKSFTYTLQPKQTGTFLVPGAKLKIGNATYESNDAQITVVQGKLIKQKPRRQSVFDDFDDFFGNTRQQPQQVTDEDFFARITFSKQNVYPGEQIVATYKIYSRNLPLNSLDDYEFPTQENFWAENIELPQQLVPQTEILEGKQYQVYTLKKEVLFPQKSGALPINPFSVTGVINRSLFSPGVKKRITSNGGNIQVKELPQPIPPSFNNQVGSYTFKGNLSKDTVKVDESIDLKLTIQGSGNLKQLSGFNIQFPSDFEAYDPQIKDNISVSGAGVSGSQTTSYLLIPRHSGKYVIDPIEFTYFDPEKKTYNTLTTDKFVITVLRQDGTIDETTINEESTDKENKPAQTLANLETNTTFKKNQSNFFLSTTYFLSIGGILIGMFAFLFARTKISNATADTQENRIKKAKKVALKQFEQAKVALEQNQNDQFYSITLGCIYKYLENKLGIETADLSKQAIQSKLIQKDVSENTAQQLIQLIENCEMAQFAPFSIGASKDTYELCLQTIEDIDQQINA